MLTNKKLISELFPIMKQKENENPELDQIDYYNHPYHEEVIKNFYDKTGYITVWWTKYGKNHIVIEVTKKIPYGKYDLATIRKNSKSKGYGYSKEYRGKGNGFYADLDNNGKIIKSEWD